MLSSIDSSFDVSISFLSLKPIFGELFLYKAFIVLSNCAKFSFVISILGLKMLFIEFDLYILDVNKSCSFRIFLSTEGS